MAEAALSVTNVASISKGLFFRYSSHRLTLITFSLSPVKKNGSMALVWHKNTQSSPIEPDNFGIRRKVVSTKASVCRYLLKPNKEARRQNSD